MRLLARRLARLERAAAQTVAADIPAPIAPRPGELAALAPQLAQYMKGAVESYQQHFGLSRPQAEAKAMAPCPSAEPAARRTPPEMLSWGDLETLYRGEPAAALDKWTQTREAAREELASGIRAAGAIQPFCASPWWLARFLAVREAIAGDRPPRSGAEQVLIDQAAQAHTLMLFWQEELIARTALANVGSRREGPKEQMTLDGAQAVEQAMGMVERLHAMCLRTMKALLDARRGSPAVVVRRAGQVNVGQQQVNVAAGDR